MQRRNLDDHRRARIAIVLALGLLALGCTTRPASGAAALSLSASNCLETPARGTYCWGATEVGLKSTATRQPNRPAGTRVETAHERCVLLADGTVVCERSGDWARDKTLTPSRALSAGVDFSAGFRGVDQRTYSQLCAVRLNGDVQCRRDLDLEFPDRPSVHSEHLFYELEATALSVAGENGCAVDKKKRVWCWGRNGFGQVDPDPSAPAYLDRAVIVKGVDKAVAVSVAHNFACALLGEGSVTCWGSNLDWQLGVSNEGLRGPQLVPGISDAVSVHTGGYFACARHSNGRLSCWGSNARSELARDPVRVEKGAPAHIPELRGVLQVRTGAAHVCALLRKGEVHCWGDNTGCQLGRGRWDRSDPSEVIELNDVTSIIARNNYSCAQDRSGQNWCWGDAPSVLDNSPFAWSWSGHFNNRPRRVARLPESADERPASHHCELEGGRVRCTGANDFGQIGGSPEVPLPRRATQVAVGMHHSCALLDNGRVWCWGSNANGQVGDGLSAHTPVVGPVQGLPTADVHGGL